MISPAKWLGFGISRDQYLLHQQSRVLWLVIGFCLSILLPVAWLFQVPIIDSLVSFSLLLCAYVLVQLEKQSLAFFFIIVSQLINFLVVPAPVHVIFFLIASLLIAMSLPIRAGSVILIVLLAGACISGMRSGSVDMLSMGSLYVLVSSFSVGFSVMYQKSLENWSRAHRAMESSKAELSMLVTSLESEISKRADTETDLRYRELLFSTVLDNIEEGVLISDELSFILSANKVAETILFSKGSNAAGIQIHKILHSDEDAQIFDRMWHESLSQKCSSSEVVECVRANGRIFSALLNLRRIQLAEKTVVMVIVRDMSKDQKLDEMQSEFVSAVSHELRTPLTSLRGAIGLLRNVDSQAMQDKMPGLLEIADQNARLLSDLVNDILDLTKLESGRVNLELNEFDLVQYLNNVLEENKPLESTFDVRFMLEVQHKMFNIVSDRLRLTQVLNNLLSNAAKFSHAGGRVSLAFEARGQHEILIRVSDTGIGIPREFQDHVFERFSQAKYQENHKVVGTGLGLNICKAIVEQMGGTIWFESIPEQGTSFFISLPIKVTLPGP